jgi:hypothetical protein
MANMNGLVFDQLGALMPSSRTAARSASETKSGKKSLVERLEWARAEKSSLLSICEC